MHNSCEPCRCRWPIVIGGALLLFSSTLVVATTGSEPTVVLPSEPIALSEAHQAAVNRRRRIYVNNDAGYDVAMGPKASSLTPLERLPQP